MNYFENLSNTVINANYAALVNAKSRATGTAKAWDNVKKKNGARYRPRGNAFKRLVQMQRTADWEHLTSALAL